MLNIKKLFTKILTELSDPTTRNCSDCNTATKTGVYKIAGGNTSHSPGANWYGTMFVMKYEGNYITQMAIAANTTTPYMYFRSKTSGSWGAWRTVTGS